MNIGILGVGAIGGLLTSQLANIEKYCLLGSSNSMDFIKEMEFFIRVNFMEKKDFFLY